MAKDTSEHTILWHDYETWGVNPQKDFPCQFAAIRTDMDLNEVGKPINIMSQIPNDYLPHPQACLVTGLTPQHSLRDGLIEAEFAQKIHAAMSQPNTCVAGYNSIRFDDEVSRFLFYRNFYDPYAREWRNGNSRWDIIDLARACYALRPEGIVWPEKEDGTPSFKLEELTAANGLEHGHAHDALSDVRATIAFAKLIKTKQPRLYDFAFSLRNKRAVMDQINLQTLTPMLHVSAMFPAINGCTSWVLPVAKHPTNPNAIVCIDLAKDPTPILTLDPEALRERLYTAQADLAEGETRPGIKLIHINKSPFITTAKAMTAENAQRLGLDREQCLAHYRQLMAQPDALKNVVALYNTPHDDKELDADQALYSGGFLTDDDKRWCERVQLASPETLDVFANETQNARLKTLLFRYRARNYPHTLTAQESERWQRHRQAKLQDGDISTSISLGEYGLQLEQLAYEYENNADKMAILKALFDYAKNL